MPPRRRSGQTPAALQNGGHMINNHKATKNTKPAAKERQHITLPPS
jgi:hypothetical protein